MSGWHSGISWRGRRSPSSRSSRWRLESAPNTAVFTVFNAVLLSPLPYEQPGRIVILNETSPQLPNASVTRYNYDDWRARAQVVRGDGRVPPDQP